MSHFLVRKLLVYQRLQTLKAPQRLDPFSTRCCLGSPSCRVEGNDAGPKYHEGVGVSCHELVDRNIKGFSTPLFGRHSFMVSWYNFLSTSFNQSVFFFLPGVKREKDRDLVMCGLFTWWCPKLPCRCGKFRCYFMHFVVLWLLSALARATNGCHFGVQFHQKFAGYPPKSHHHQVLHSKCYLEATSNPFFRQFHIPTWLTRTPWHHGLLHGKILPVLQKNWRRHFSCQTKSLTCRMT